MSTTWGLFCTDDDDVTFSDPEVMRAYERNWKYDDNMLYAYNLTEFHPEGFIKRNHVFDPAYIEEVDWLQEEMGLIPAGSIAVGISSGRITDWESAQKWLSKKEEISPVMVYICEGQGWYWDRGLIWELNKECGFYTLVQPDSNRKSQPNDSFVKAIGDCVDKSVAPLGDMIVGLKQEVFSLRHLLEGARMPDAVRGDQGLPVQEWYTPHEFGQRVNLSAWMVRQHCNKGRLRGRKLPSGEWMISHEELIRYRNERLLPKRKG